jgi:hypothetical protein
MLRRQANLKKYKPLFDDEFKYAHYLELKKTVPKSTNASSEKPKGGSGSLEESEKEKDNTAHHSASTVLQSSSTASLSSQSTGNNNNSHSYEARKKLICELIASPDFEEELVVPDFMKLLCRTVELFATCEGIRVFLITLLIFLFIYLFRRIYFIYFILFMNLFSCRFLFLAH